jgi:hypothetical protein
MGFDPGKRLAMAAIAAALLAVSQPSSAQSSADRETARGLMKQGDFAFEAGDFAAALKAYETAHAIMRVPTTGVALARAQEKSSKLLEARDTALSVVRSPVQPSEPAVFTEARTAAQDLGEAIEPRIPSLTIAVDGAPVDQVQVSIDGAELPRKLIAVPRKLNPGKHVVTASAPGFHQARADVDLAEAASETLTLRLEPSTGPTTESWPKGSNEPAPSHAGDAAKTHVSPLVYIGFGVGAVGLVVGSVTGVLSLSKASSAEEQCDGNACKEAAGDDIDGSKSLANVSNVAFGVGAVGIGVGVFGLLSSGGEPKTGRAKPGVEPLVGTRFVGMRGVF